MHGNVRWNFVLGLLGFVITTLLSLSSNIWMTSLTRGVVAFIVWFAIGFALRFAIHQLLTPSNSASSSQKEKDDNVGAAVDYTTPDESESLYQLLQSSPTDKESSSDEEIQTKSEFQPLSPPKLVSKSLNDEQMAQAVRHLSQ